VLGLPTGKRQRQIPGVADIDEEKDQQGGGEHVRAGVGLRQQQLRRRERAGVGDERACA